MLRNYLKIALRNFQRNRLASLINVLGLTIGLTSCLLIVLYIQNELNYDGFEKKGDRIARVIMEYSFNGGGEKKKGNYTSTKVAPVFKRTFPQVESAVRMTQQSRVVSFKEKLFTEDRFMYADSSFFDVFSFHLLQGDSHTALSGPDKVLLTESAAKKYFGDGSAVGQVLTVGSSPYLVTGVIQDCPGNSQIKFDLLASFSSLGENQEETYWDANYTTYLLLRDAASRSALEARLPAFMQKEMTGQGAIVNFYLEPFMGIHLHSAFRGFEANNNIAYIYVLAAVALLILVIAGFTYINLSTARSMERAREVGVRKVMGAGKRQLFWQFIGESLLFCGLSIVISLCAATLLLPWFNTLTGTCLSQGALFSPTLLGIALGIGIVVGMLAGAYPAVILSGFQPVKVLKGAFRNTEGGAWTRKSLIVFQFVISVFLIVSTAMVQKQLYYIRHKQLGYDRSHVLLMPIDPRMQGGLPLFKTEFKTNPNILSVAVCNNSPVNIGSGFNMRSSIMPASQQIAVTADPVDEDYIRTLGMTLVAGTDLDAQDVKNADSVKNYRFILNESAARELGWTPQEAIGKKMFLDDSRPGFVKGVVRDFHFESMHNPIKPIVLFSRSGGRQLLVKISGNDLSGTVAFLEKKWKALAPYRPFEYRFLDDDFNAMYQSELRLGRILDVFAGIAIVLACLGLFGLSSYAAQQRVREIGIRKVLGASVGHLVVLLSGDFVRLAGIAILIAFPLSWWAAARWLQGFAYRTSLNGDVFLIAGIFTLSLTIITVSLKAITTARLTPVKNLRSE